MIPRKIFDLFLTTFIILSLAFIQTIITQSLQVESIGNKIRCLERERQALLNFKKELIDDYGVLSSWDDDHSNRTDCCKWRGVRCHNTTNHVLLLDLHGDLLRGSIGPSLIELRGLNYLDLSSNDFSTGLFPDLFGSLSKLRYLNLSFVYFNGPIPRNLGNLTELRYLDLQFSTENYISSNLDWISSNLKSLEYLDLSFNNLSKATNWLQALSTLPSIKELYLKRCELPQIVNPSSSFILNSSAPLALLDLSENERLFSSNNHLVFNWFLHFRNSLTSLYLTSTSLRSNNIPDAFQNMTSLSLLDLSYNMLEYIPKCFGNISSLNRLSIPGNSLTGQLSDTMMNLSGPLEYKLQILTLDSNDLSGPLPNISRFPFLTTLSLSYNNLSGTISEGFLQLPNLVTLDLSSNQFTGQVPDLSFCKWSLTDLFLGNNMFNGKLTKSIGGLSKLESLFLGSNKLDDTIKEDHVANLSRLRWFELSFNLMLNVKWDNSNFIPPFQLWGLHSANCNLGPRFPDWLRTQKQLVYLDISNAQISDKVSNLWDIVSHNLVYLNASNNRFYGFFPNISFFMFDPFSYKPLFGYSFLKNEFALDLSRNNILGSIHFLCNCSKLNLIDLSHNQFNGNIPDCFTNFEDLEYLNLANNHFHGKIPSSFGNMFFLSSLYLRNNNLSGGIPQTMRNCTRLKMFDLSENRLSGEIPLWIQSANLRMLVVLVLHSNEFYGAIPNTLCNLDFIQVLDLSKNKISGKIPKCLGSLTSMTGNKERKLLLSYGWWIPATTLISIFKYEIVNIIWKREMVDMKARYLATVIDFSNNNLVGEIPWEITTLVGLLGLNLSSNNLMGPIPQNISHLELLNVLDLSKNRLSGAIPSSLSELSHLGILDLSYNNLSGRIPLNGHLLTFDDPTSYIGNPNLCGHPLNKSCPGDHGNEETNNLQHENNHDKDEDEDNYISEGFYICLGVGFVVGFWGIFGTILLNDSFRYSFLEMAKAIDDFVYVRVKLTMIRIQRQFQNSYVSFNFK